MYHRRDEIYSIAEGNKRDIYNAEINYSSILLSAPLICLWLWTAKYRSRSVDPSTGYLYLKYSSTNPRSVHVEAKQLIDLQLKKGPCIAADRMAHEKNLYATKIL